MISNLEAISIISWEPTDPKSAQQLIHIAANTGVKLVLGMYGPPQDCKGKFGREDKSAQMYSAFVWRSALLAMMSCARVCPSKSVGR